MTEKEKEFTNIVREHRSTIYSVCFMFAKCGDEADDLFQEVLIKLWHGFDSFEHRSNISTWIWRISLNTCISMDRQKHRSSKLKLDMSRDLYTAEDSDSRQMQMLHRRIHRLQPFDRAIVMLWLENMSYEEIAAIVGISVKNVSVKLYRIKEQLKSMSNE
ncbi:MAG: sigma-70 family RNA polymerase sigma factor [Alistipes sp.]|nr:sigma-70 family RNA polymerase sigma factor [Alistipes sp.]